MELTKEYVEKNLIKLETALGSVEVVEGTEHKVLEMAKRYAADARHYMEQGKLVTAIGAVEYAHGLLDGAVGCGALKVVKEENRELFVF